MPEIDIKLSNRSELQQSDLDSVTEVDVAKRAEYVKILIEGPQSPVFNEEIRREIDPHSDDLSELDVYVDDRIDWLQWWYKLLTDLSLDGYNVTYGGKLGESFQASKVGRYHTAVEEAQRMEEELTDTECEVKLLVFPDAIPDEVITDLEDRFTHSSPDDWF